MKDAGHVHKHARDATFCATECAQAMGTRVPRGYDVSDKVDGDAGRPSLVPIFCFALNVHSPLAVASMLRNPGGHIMSRGSCAANRLVDPHVFPTPTR